MLRPPLAQLIVGNTGGGTNKMTCDLNTTALPNTLTRLDLNGLSLKCCIDSTSLAIAVPLLSILNIQDNVFTGVVNLATLPQSLTGLNIYNNKFTVQIQNLTTLPPNMSYLNIGFNTCAGELDLTGVHSNLTAFVADNCSISCCLDFAKMSNGGTQYFAGTGHLYEYVPKVSLIDWPAARDECAARTVRDLNFTSFQYLASLNAANNNFTGLLDLNGITALNLGSFDAGYNPLETKCPLDLSDLLPKLRHLNLRWTNVNCSVDFTVIRSATG